MHCIVLQKEDEERSTGWVRTVMDNIGEEMNGLGSFLHGELTGTKIQDCKQNGGGTSGSEQGTAGNEREQAL